MPDTGPASAWSEVASWYDRLLSAGSGPHETALQILLDLLPDPLDGSWLDVACGQGIATRALVDRGATHVVGVDSAEPMLDLARRRTNPAAPITWLLDDAQRLDRCATGRFAGATCQLGLMDIPDLNSCLSSIRRVLRPAGHLIFVISHPALLAPHAETRTDAQSREGRLVSRTSSAGSGDPPIHTGYADAPGTSADRWRHISTG